MQGCLPAVADARHGFLVNRLQEHLGPVFLAWKLSRCEHAADRFCTAAGAHSKLAQADEYLLPGGVVGTGAVEQLQKRCQVRLRAPHPAQGVEGFDPV